MFEQLTDRLEKLFSNLRGRGRITEEDLDRTLRELRLAFLEADVGLPVIESFLASLRENLRNKEVLKSLTPYQTIIKATAEELTRILGEKPFKLTFASRPPTVIVLFGLQGVGKTTLAGKLAYRLRREGRSPLLVGADLTRPAAREQLATLASRASVSFFSEGSTPVEVAKASLEAARRMAKDVVLIDTQGRLAIDEDLVEELREIVGAVSPHYSFLVIDALTGQDAVQSARNFNERLAMDALILTKLDGDSRGGAALSAVYVTGVPIAYSSVGEKLEDLEPFYPDRMASRILGMGDVLSLIERAQARMDAATVERTAKSLLEGRLTLDDYLAQLRQVRAMGSLRSLLSMMPGVPKELKNLDVDEKELSRVEAMICSMTKEERVHPEIIDMSRKRRIAAGSGLSVAEVSQMLNAFNEAQKMLSRMGLMGQAAVKRVKKKTSKNAARKGGRYTPKGTR